MSTLIYRLFSSSSLVCLGLYHLISTTRNHLISTTRRLPLPAGPLAAPDRPLPLRRRLHPPRLPEAARRRGISISKLRALAILDLLFLLHVVFVFILVLTTYAVVAKLVGTRRPGPYEALPTAADTNHIQMKALTGTQA